MVAMKITIPKCFDWITGRRKCNAREMFDRLKETVEADIKIAEKHCPELKFHESSLDKFAVFLRSGLDDDIRRNNVRKGVRFHLEGSQIKVQNAVPPGEPLFTLRASLLDGGNCTFLVDDKPYPYHPWQVSRLALEDVIFND